MTDRTDTIFDCVEPDVGDRIWQLDQPALDAAERRKLEAHVVVCHACRLQRELDARARRLVRDGELGLDGAPVARMVPARRPRATAAAAVLAVAASLVLALLSPPRPVGVDVTVRGEDDVVFTRPVEGEVVKVDGCRLSWTEVDGATGYTVRISSRDGSFTWQGDTDRAVLDLPDEVALAAGGSYKALLSARPADLLPPWRTSVAFEAGSSWRVAAHRLLRARHWIHGLGAAGLVLLGFAAVRRRFP